MISKKTSGGPGRPGEDLEQVALFVAVGLDAELLQDVDRNANATHARGSSA